MSESPIKINEPCEATIIPAGDKMVIPSGSEVDLLQALGGSLTVQYKGILLRIDPTELHKVEASQLAEIEGLSEAKTAVSSGDTSRFSKDLLWQALKECYDPEIPVNIVDLGLIYDLSHTEAEESRHDVKVSMTLTAQGCGMGPVIAEDARRKLEALDCVRSASVEIVWDPPWTPHMISPEGRMQLGLT